SRKRARSGAPSVGRCVLSPLPSQASPGKATARQTSPRTLRARSRTSRAQPAQFPNAETHQMETIRFGNPARFTETFRNIVTGALADPSVITLKLRGPSAIETVY